MAKITALLIAASVLVLSIALLFLIARQRYRGETRHIREQPPCAGAAVRAGFAPLLLLQLQEGARLPNRY